VKPFVTYTVLRLALFVACYSLIIGVYMAFAGVDQVPRFWPLLAAVVVSSALSIPLLRGPREAFAQRVEKRAEAAARAFDERRSREDVD